jgi:multidrug efflux system membrane fusion protein
VLDNRDGRFTPGLFARMKLVSPTSYHAVLVDDRAIGTDLGKRFVFVVDEQGVVHYRQVELGRLVGGLRVVTNGLGGGEVVVVNGLQRVRPGVAVAQTRVEMQGAAPALARLEPSVSSAAAF